MNNISVAHLKKMLHLKFFMPDKPLNLSGQDHPTSLRCRNGMKGRIVPKKVAVYIPDLTVHKRSCFSNRYREGGLKIDRETVKISPSQVYLKPGLTRRMGMVQADFSGMLKDHEQFLGIAKEAKRMAKIKTKRIRWDFSTSPDVAGYKLYWAIGQGVNYDADSVELGNVNEVILPDAVPSFPRIAGDIEIGVTALNYKGNESDMSVCSAPFDFTAPEAPLNLVVEDT